MTSTSERDDPLARVCGPEKVYPFRQKGRKFTLFLPKIEVDARAVEDMLPVGWFVEPRHVANLGDPSLDCIAENVFLPLRLECRPLSHTALKEKQWVGHAIVQENVMGKKLYIGNLSYDVSSSDLEAMLAPHGTVQSAEVIMDRSTGQSKGFGFVEMNSDSEAQAAISALDGQEHGGRSIKVNEAKPREPRSGGGGYGGGGGRRDRY